jgi:hypothetical protein
VRASLGASVSDSVWASVEDSVRASLGASVSDSVRVSVGDSVYGQHESHWLAFYDFFMEVNGLKKETKKLNGLWKIAKNAGWFLPHKDICWISERHNVLLRNERGQLHNASGMALRYPDGWGIYALNGVRFREEMYWKIVNGEMTEAETLAIQDIDQRTQAMRFMKPEAIVKALNGTMLDEVQKMASDGSIVSWKLYRLPKGDVFEQDAYYCLMDCPSTGKQHFEGVEKSVSVAEAMAWAESNEFCTVTPEEWKLRVPLVHEN